MAAASEFWAFKARISPRRYFSLGVVLFEIFFIFWVVLTFSIGEYYYDTNGNRRWDPGEAFIDTYADGHYTQIGPLLNPVLYPSPVKVVEAFGEILCEYDLLMHLAYSILRVLAGFLGAVLLAVPLGILMGSFITVEAVFNPFFAFVRYLPLAALIPFFLIWCGIGETAKVLFIFWGIFFYLVVLISDEVAKVQKEFLEIALTLGATRWQVLTRVIVPASLPGIFDHCRAMLGIGWTYIILVEMLAAQYGIGKLIYESHKIVRVDWATAALLSIGAVGIICDYVLKFLHGILFPWVEQKK